jgi:hypothetical protein
VTAVMRWVTFPVAETGGRAPRPVPKSVTKYPSHGFTKPCTHSSSHQEMVGLFEPFEPLKEPCFVMLSAVKNLAKARIYRLNRLFTESILSLSKHSE